ncbi:MAG TPA: hypothetical protein VMM92_07940, partial [Thermoanaerobaculia bacterium]|nr:hypothetical protein [Thermoanaerobaculia bacterium]
MDKSLIQFFRRVGFWASVAAIFSFLFTLIAFLGFPTLPRVIHLWMEASDPSAESLRLGSAEQRYQAEREARERLENEKAINQAVEVERAHAAAELANERERIGRIVKEGTAAPPAGEAHRWPVPLPEGERPTKPPEPARDPVPPVSPIAPPTRN